MGYDIRLCDPVTGETLHTEVPHQMRGGTYAIGGTTEMWLNITYNYASWYYRPGVFPSSPDDDFTEARGGIRSIYRKTGAESITVLKRAIDTLLSCEEDISPEERAQCEQDGITGYWMPTRGNAIKPLYQLLAMAQMRPDGIWNGG